MKDLFVLVADKDMEAALKGLLSQPSKIGIKAIEYEIRVHPRHDPGCYNDSPEFLIGFVKDYRYALVIFDYHGCGAETKYTPEQIQEDLEAKISDKEWDQRIRVVVIDPELEVWVWSDSPNVEDCLGWNKGTPHLKLRDWLKSEKYSFLPDSVKPRDPKKALRSALRQANTPLSSTIFEQLAKTVSFRRCQDIAFIRLCKTLQTWFGAS
ncbi:MAG: hypothetical protein MUF87_11760 [Anaerolineae bacterium]|nr:hypothetical protein [Anaerolineae bacterium]